MEETAFQANPYKTKSDLLKLVIIFFVIINLSLVLVWLMRLGLEEDLSPFFNPNFLEYKSQKYGVKLEYPLGWVKIDLKEISRAKDVAEEESLIPANSDGIVFVLPEEAAVVLLMEKFPAEVGLEQVLEGTLTELEKEKTISVIKQEKIPFSYLSAYQVFFTIQREKAMIALAVKYNTIYTFIYRSSPGTYEQNLPKVEEMIKSVEFLD